MGVNSVQEVKKVSKAAAGKKRLEPVAEEVALDPRETLAILLRLRLGRAPSPAALAALLSLDDSQMVPVWSALDRPAEEAIPLVRAMLNVDL